jgi:hypothetical protein
VRSAAFSASSRLFDLNGETNRVRKKHNRAVIAGDVRRFGHVINKDGVLSTHNHLFVGSDGGSARWATVCSLIATAKFNNVEAFSVASWNIAHSSDASSSES